MEDKTRIDYDHKGDLDDVAISDVTMFRLEYMDNNRIWIRCYLEDREDVIINLSSNSKINGVVERD